jgi:hypothetical protein
MIGASFGQMIENEEYARISAAPAAKLAKRLVFRLNKCIPILENIPTDPAN